MGLGLVGHELAQRARQADGLGGEIPAHELGAAARGVPLVEQQVQHGQDRGGAFRQQVRGWHAVRDAGIVDLALRPHESLRHRRLGHEERSRDLGGGQAGERAQGERDLRLDRECRVAAGEDQPEPVVGHAAGVVHRWWLVGHEDSGLPHLLRTALRASQPIERAVARGRGQPGAGIRGHAVTRPPFERPRERVLRALLGEVPVARGPDEGGDDAPPLVPEHTGDCILYRAAGHGSTTSPRWDAPRWTRAWHQGSSTPPRWLRRGPCSRPGRSRPAAPWSPRTARRR